MTCPLWHPHPAPHRSGSLLVMAGATQRHWEHQLPVVGNCRSVRYNLTFRRVVPLYFSTVDPYERHPETDGLLTRCRYCGRKCNPRKHPPHRTSASAIRPTAPVPPPPLRIAATANAVNAAPTAQVGSPARPSPRSPCRSPQLEGRQDPRGHTQRVFQVYWQVAHTVV